MSPLFSWMFSDRRQAARYPLDVPVKITRGGRSRASAAVQGQAIDMSSSGLRFTAPVPLPVGSILRLDLDWPVRMGGDRPMALRVKGRVVRSTEGCVAVTILHREFRVKRREPVVQDKMMGAAQPPAKEA